MRDGEPRTAISTFRTAPELCRQRLPIEGLYLRCESLSTSGCSRVQINVLNAVVSTFTANSFAFLVQLPSQSSPEEEEEQEEEEEKEGCNNTIVKL